jgi:hypothetical protein
MSRYLVRRIDDHPWITLRIETEVVAVEGNGGSLERVPSRQVLPDPWRRSDRVSS